MLRLCPYFIIYFFSCLHLRVHHILKLIFRGGILMCNARKTIDRCLGRLCKILEDQENRLNEILNSDATPDEKDVALSNYRAKKAIAKDFIEDIAEILPAIQGKRIGAYVVAKETFKKQVEKADFAGIMFDSKYCKLAQISSYPNKPYRIICIESIENVL